VAQHSGERQQKRGDASTKQQKAQNNCKKHTKSHEKPKQKQENQTQMFANKEIAKGKNGMR
jgi:hypothetical protein